MKKRSLAFSLSWKIGLAVIAFITISAVISARNAVKATRNSFTEDNKELIKQLGVATLYRNNIQMQQMRSYTMLDDVGRKSTDPVEIQEMLMKRAKERQKNFTNIGYADYDSGLCYFDDGRIEDESEPCDIFFGLEVFDERGNSVGSTRRAESAKHQGEAET